MINKSILTLCLAVALLLPCSHLYAQDFGTKPEAEKMALQAVDLINKSGKEAAFAEFDKEGSGYKVKDMYVFSFGLDGYVFYHGGNKTLEGKNLSTLKDADGNLIIVNIINTCKEKGEGWIDYKWSDAKIGKIMPKSSYVKKTADGTMCVGVGVYTR